MLESVVLLKWAPRILQAIGLWHPRTDRITQQPSQTTISRAQMDTQRAGTRELRPGSRSDHNAIRQNNRQGHRRGTRRDENSMGQNRWPCMQHILCHCIHTSQRKNEANGWRNFNATAQAPTHSAQIRVYNSVCRLQLPNAEERARMHRTVVYDTKTKSKWAWRRSTRLDARKRPVCSVHTV